MSKMTHTVMRHNLEARGYDIFEDFNILQYGVASVLSKRAFNETWHYQAFTFWDCLEEQYVKVYKALFDNPADVLSQAIKDCSYMQEVAGVKELIEPEGYILVRWVRDREYLRHGFTLKPIKA